MRSALMQIEHERMILEIGMKLRADISVAVHGNISVEGGSGDLQRGTNVVEADGFVTE